MTKNEVLNIANRLDDQSKLLIEKEVEERLEILREGDLSEDELEEMELYLFASLVFQEYLDGEYELLEDERQALFDEMEEMYNKYSDLLVRARIEEKVGKKKRMTLELMRIRERLLQSKQDYKDLKQMMKDNRNKKDELKKLTKKEKMKDYSKAARKDDARGGGLLEGLPAKQARAQENKMRDLERRVRQNEANKISTREKMDPTEAMLRAINRDISSSVNSRGNADNTGRGTSSSRGSNPEFDKLRDYVNSTATTTIPPSERITDPSGPWSTFNKENAPARDSNEVTNDQNRNENLAKQTQTH